MHTEPGLAGVFVCLHDYRSGPVIVAVITFEFPMKTAVPAIVVLLTIFAIAYCEFGNAVVLDGHYELPITLSNFEGKTVVDVKYATLNSDVVQMAIDNYPSSEPSFHPIGEDGNILIVSFGSYASPLLKREWGYAESFDTVLFRIQYRNRPAEFRAIKVPERNSNASIQLAL